MDVQEVRDQVRIQEWMQLIRERNDSGMTIKAWCETKGLSENQYYYWLRKIRKTACTALKNRSDKAPLVREDGPVFAEVNVLPQTPMTTSGITIHMSQADIHIGKDVCANQIKTILKVIANVE